MSRLRSVISGVIIAGQSWSVGLNHTSSNEAPSDADMASLANGIYDSFVARVASASYNLAARLPTVGDVAKCTLYWYAGDSGPAGKVGVSTHAAVPGTQTGSIHPPQCALVASLLSGLPGRNNRGRVYLPYTTGAPGTDLQASAAETTNLATSIANWIGDIDTLAFGADLAAVVTSPRVAAPTVVTVHADSVIDTQRRRRDKLAASHLSSIAVP